MKPLASRWLLAGWSMFMQWPLLHGAFTSAVALGSAARVEKVDVDAPRGQFDDVVEQLAAQPSNWS
jgi:hypothetical protein